MRDSVLRGVVLSISSVVLKLALELSVCVKNICDDVFTYINICICVYIYINIHRLRVERCCLVD